MKDLLQQLLADQRRRWTHGDRPTAESYLVRHPELASAPEQLLDLIYNEIFLRECQGETPQLAEYLRRFPDHAEALRLQFAVHQAIQTDAVLPEVPGYRLFEEIGHGSMALVYRAHNLGRDRAVAVKLLRPEHARRRSARKRFLTEARAASALDHPNIVKVFEAGESAAGPYLVMELIEGPSLEAEIQRGPMDVDRAVQLLIPIAEAVHHAHGQGIIHRDLKPANILLVSRPSTTHHSPLTTHQPKITDFGLAKVLRHAGGAEQSSTQKGTLLGTPCYMPPEQMGGSDSKAGPANDVYSLGGILFTMLTGRPPFEADSLMALLLLIRSAEVPPSVRCLRSEVPGELERICRRCLSKLPADRYPTALALAAALRRFAGSKRPSVPAGLYVLVGADGKQTLLNRPITAIGRSVGSDVRLTAPEVSRQHCRIVREGNEVIVEDLGSQHGTHVNGWRVTRTVLRDGDRLEIAGAAFQVRLLPGEETRGPH